VKETGFRTVGKKAEKGEYMKRVRDERGVVLNETKVHFILIRRWNVRRACGGYSQPKI
jgi:hypothetical protein